MIIKHFTDNDLYKFTTMNAIQKLYPKAKVKYAFINRANAIFPDGFAEALGKEIKAMEGLLLTKEEEAFITNACYYFDPVFIDFLKGYRYNSEEVRISQNKGELKLEIEGYWYRTVLWEVPLMAIISELYFKMTHQKAINITENATLKAKGFTKIGANYSEFGTRRRFSFEVQDQVIGVLKKHSGKYLKGTSNLYLAMKHDLIPIGTHPHEWFMFHGAAFGYRYANKKALENWTQVYQGDLGIALTDTYSTDVFFRDFDTKYSKLFDGVRWDSGDAIEFTDKVINHYESLKINPKTKTVVYSDALNLKKVEEIKNYVNGRVNDVYGIGTYLSNDVGVKPLNMVIKIIEAQYQSHMDYVSTVKLSDVKGKYTGSEREIELCKQTLEI